MAYSLLPSLEFLKLKEEAKACRVCEASLPRGPKPIFQAHPSAVITIVGQAPGTKVHETGIPWNDASGDRLRAWMGVSREVFYDETRVAIVPMGLCYPGRGKGGDLPPRPECAPLWQMRFLSALPHIQLILLVGAWAQRFYLGKASTLTETVRNFLSLPQRFFPLVHPSPRNQLWLKRNPWFEADLLPELKVRVHALVPARSENPAQ